MFWDRKEYVKQNIYYKKDNCPFCKNIELQKKYIIKETKYWNISYNKFPYYWENIHLMAIPKEHKTYTYELTDEELIDYRNVEIFMKEYYKNTNYYSFIRQSIWWRSIEHLHYHYLPWHISYDETSQENIFRIKNK